jgi:hypothetical protein
MCRAQKRALVSLGFQALSALIQRGQVKLGPQLPRPRDVSVSSSPIPTLHTRTPPLLSRVDNPPCTPPRHIRSPVPTLTFVPSYNPCFNFLMVRKRHVTSRKRMWLAWGIIALGVASGAAQDSSPAQAELSHDSTVTVRHSLHSGCIS